MGKMECHYFVGLLFVFFIENAVALLPKEVCLLPASDGPCRANIPRFHYNTLTQKCEEFIYGGCAGNANNFQTFQECHKTCWKIPKIPQICRFKPEMGVGRAYFIRYFFNMTTMQCEQFVYGGDHGNRNNFRDLKSCTEYCKPPKTIPVLCLDALNKGSCAASIVRYYYNQATKMCEEFMYSGCGGSSNNFNTRQSCLDVCVKDWRLHKMKRKVPSGRQIRRKLYPSQGI